MLSRLNTTHSAQQASPVLHCVRADHSIDLCCTSFDLTSATTQHTTPLQPPSHFERIKRSPKAFWRKPLTVQLGTKKNLQSQRRDQKQGYGLEMKKKTDYRAFWKQPDWNGVLRLLGIWSWTTKQGEQTSWMKIIFNFKNHRGCGFSGMLPGADLVWSPHQTAVLLSCNNQWPAFLLFIHLHLS